MILNDPLSFGSESVSPPARDLLQRMLAKDIAARIKPEAVKKHPFFASIDFDKLLMRDLPTPVQLEVVCH
jgi:hypothetical protein